MKIEEAKMAEFWACLVDQVAGRTADLVVERLGGSGVGEEPAGEEVLDVAGAAAFLRLGTSTVYKLSSSGKLASVKLGGRRVFRRSDLDAYLDAHRRGDAVVNDLAKAVRSGE